LKSRPSGGIPPNRPNLPLGVALKSQARTGEVTLILGTERHTHRRTLHHRLLSKSKILLGLHLVSCGLAWGQTLLLEIRSLYFRIRDMHERGLVDRYEMGLVCASCQRRGTPQSCKATHAYIRGMRELGIRLPWLSYSDSNLIREGWNLAFRLMLDTLDCGTVPDLRSDQTLCASAYPDSGKSMLARVTQQDSKRGSSNLTPSRE